LTDVYEQADRWQAVDAVLAVGNRRVAHPAGAVDFFDAFEVVAPGFRFGAAGTDQLRLIAAGDG
jgi:hypothetical protein